MRLSGYTNPLREFERKEAPDYASREFRDPGLRMSMSSGLGSLHRTMPHLRPPMRLQAGGGLDPVGQIYAASRPNTYNPDPRERQVLNAMRTMGTQFRSPAMHTFPLSTASFPYAEGGQAEDDDTGAPDPQELMQPDQDQAEAQGEEKQIVVEAMLALEGRHPDPEEALQRFVDTFGRDALDELEAMVHAHKLTQAEPGDEDNPAADETAPGAAGDEDESSEDDMGAAGGGLLSGPGSGQSDEIHGNTPSGRPVLLSDGEYVIDAPTVAALGDGSTNAGARRLDEFRKTVRKQAYGHDKQAKPMASGGRAIVVQLG